MCNAFICIHCNLLITIFIIVSLQYVCVKNNYGVCNVFHMYIVAFLFPMAVHIVYLVLSQCDVKVSSSH